MPVARSVSASQLSREAPVSPVSTPTGDPTAAAAGGLSVLQQKAHTLDRFSKPSLLNGQNESRRKRAFMSFRLNKKSGKRKDAAAALECVQQSNSSSSNNGDCGDSMDGAGSDSSSATSVKPKKRHLTRVGSFVRRVASRVQAVSPVLPSVGMPPPPPRPKTAPPAAPTTDSTKPPPPTSTSSTVALSPSNAVTANASLPAAQNYVMFQDGKIPAVMGLRNHGNTCYINAIVQCLNHTDVLAEYFVLDAYKQDLRRCNRIGNRKTTSGARRGEMTEQVAAVLKSLWSLRYVSDVSLALKACVDRHEASYRGGSQHDAAEFLMFLLGKVHDDLNTASKRKYKKIKNSYGRPDEVVASETLNNHLRCNSSFVQDIFQAQFRSSLRCPHCQKESNTFDPFMCVSLPIPHKELMPIYVTVVYLNQQPKQVCLGMSVVSGSNFDELRATVALDCGLELSSLIITEIDGSGFHRTFADDCSVECIGSGGSVHAIELPVDNKHQQQDHGPFVLITWINAVAGQPENIRFGGVYQSHVARDITYEDLQKLLLKEMATMVSIHTLTTQQQCGLFRVLVCDGSVEGASIGSSVELPLYSQCVDQALALCCPQQPQHLKLLLCWQEQDKQKYIVDPVDHVEQHSSVEELKKNLPQPPPTTLADCLKLHSSAEQLSSGDAWHCPTCDRKQQGVKRLMLWSAPQILVLHLKRFRQSPMLGSSSSKLNTFVSFPLKNVDISEHVAQRSTSASAAKASSYSKVSQENNKNMSHSGRNSPEGHNKNESLVGKAGNNNKGDNFVVGSKTGTTKNENMLGKTGNNNKMVSNVSAVGGGVWSPWRKPKKMYLHQLDDKHVYDLYAVCNHHGKDMQGGHYTALCHNPSAGEWYQFDDSRVQAVKEDQVVTQDAYLLFYQRRSNDICSVESGPNKQHWSYRIPRDSLPASLNPPLAKQTQAKQDTTKGGVNEKDTETSNDNDKVTGSASSSDATATGAASAATSVAKVFERGRSYGTLPSHGRVLQEQDSIERDNCSDTEAPLAMHEESPIKKKRISDVQERRESELEEEEAYTAMEISAPHSPAVNNAVTSPSTDSVFTNGIDGHDDTINTGEHLVQSTHLQADGQSVSDKCVRKPVEDNKDACPNTQMNGYSMNHYNESNDRPASGKVSNKIETVLESCKERRNSSGYKTVLISRSQAVPAETTASCLCSSKSSKSEGVCTCSTSRIEAGQQLLTQSKQPSNTTTGSNKSAVVVGINSSSSNNRTSRSTPDVLIQPASPAVLAAHKKSVITVTLRQRSPSASSSQQSVSRSPSSCSNTSRTSRASMASRASLSSSKMSHAGSITSFSPETLASIITVNGVSLADNEELNAEFASSLAVASASSATLDDGDDTAPDSSCACEVESDGSAGIGTFIAAQTTARASLRNGHNNKTASYVHVHNPSLSPRPSNKARGIKGRSPNSSANSTKSRTTIQNKLSPNGYSVNVRPPSVSSGTFSCSANNGYSHCAPSIVSRNTQNNARTMLDSVPCKNKCYKSSSVTSSSSGTISYPCSTNNCSEYCKTNNSDVILRNSCASLDGGSSNSNVECSCRSKYNSCTNGSSSKVNNVKCSVNRHSSGSLDGSSCSRKCGVRARPRHGSECLACTCEEKKLSTEHNLRINKPCCVFAEEKRTASGGYNNDETKCSTYEYNDKKCLEYKSSSRGASSRYFSSISGGGCYKNSSVGSGRRSQQDKCEACANACSSCWGCGGGSINTTEDAVKHSCGNRASGTVVAAASVPESSV
uniref:ubiquitinyl hydrolase 1 n=1 Tax=Hirondellea gigas TaxID=1518452 RepID=A0A6A7G1W9_9CRUS